MKNKNEILEAADRIIDMIDDMTTAEVDILLNRIIKKQKRMMREKLKDGDANPPPIMHFIADEDE